MLQSAINSRDGSHKCTMYWSQNSVNQDTCLEIEYSNFAWYQSHAIIPWYSTLYAGCHDQQRELHYSSCDQQSTLSLPLKLASFHTSVVMHWLSDPDVQAPSIAQNLHEASHGVLLRMAVSVKSKVLTCQFPTSKTLKWHLDWMKVLTEMLFSVSLHSWVHLYLVVGCQKKPVTISV